MLQILLIVECVGCSAAFSAVAWLRRLSGQRLDSELVGGLFITPILTLACVVLVAWLVIHEQQMGTFAPETSSTAIGLAVFLGIVLAAMIRWVVVEGRGFRARMHSISRDADGEEDDSAGGKRNSDR